MKFSIEKKTLREGLARMNSMIGSNDLQAGIVTIEADEFNGITLRRTSFLGQMKLDIGGIVKEGWVGSVNFDLLSNASARLDDEFFEFDGDATQMTMKGGKTTLKMGLFPSDEVPPVMSEPSGTPSIKLAATLLEKAIKACEAAMYKEKGRPELSGIGFRVMYGKLCTLAADGRRIHVFEIVERSEPLGEFVAGYDQGYFIPVESIGSITKMIGGVEKDVAIYFTDRKVIFSCSTFEIQAPILEANPPNFIPVMESFRLAQTIEVKGKELAGAALRGAGIMQEDRSPIYLSAEQNRISVRATGAKRATTFNEDIDGTTTGDFTVKLNANYLGDMIAPHAEETLKIQIGDNFVQIRSGNVYSMTAIMRDVKAE